MRHVHSTGRRELAGLTGTNSLGILVIQSAAVSALMASPGGTGFGQRGSSADQRCGTREARVHNNRITGPQSASRCQAGPRTPMPGRFRVSVDRVGIRAFRGGDRISLLYFNGAGGLNIEVLPAEWPDPARSHVFHIRPDAEATRSREIHPYRTR